MLASRFAITEEPISDIIETELWPLLVEHREELATHKALMELAPDVERYREMERAGVFLALIAREGARIVGYSGNVVTPHLHYRRIAISINDVLFVDPRHRGTVGLRLIDATERASKARGAITHCWHAKPGTALEQILRRRQYPVQDVVYMKVL